MASHVFNTLWLMQIHSWWPWMLLVLLVWFIGFPWSRYTTSGVCSSVCNVDGWRDWLSSVTLVLRILKRSIQSYTFCWFMVRASCQFPPLQLPLHMSLFDLISLHSHRLLVSLNVLPSHKVASAPLDCSQRAATLRYPKVTMRYGLGTAITDDYDCRYLCATGFAALPDQGIHPLECLLLCLMLMVDQNLPFICYTCSSYSEAF